MNDFVVALGLALALEGLFYGGFPSAARRMAAQVATLPDSALRAAGIGAAAAGVFLVWLVRG